LPKASHPDLGQEHDEHTAARFAESPTPGWSSPRFMAHAIANLRSTESMAAHNHDTGQPKFPLLVNW